ncbi:BNR repeat domain protein [Chondromyces apiculatus DSM 436]|uniref:BNR repeat domain protein n=1 Tax=Chondromyces apiculatus DSM 436 TaxID=1192034 RepID=A0A017THR7_9BACT|nr:BNR repeat domain protein [Chondromyces apiculatus DSM 436]
MYTWGDNTFNQLGTEDAFDAESAVKIELPPAAKLSFISIASCALLEDRRIMCWGSNTSGQLGDGTTTTRSTPAPVFWH